jgi:hypothetical protein
VEAANEIHQFIRVSQVLQFNQDGNVFIAFSISIFGPEQLLLSLSYG